MIRNNNNLTPMPFFTDVKYQLHRQSYAFGEMFPLSVPNNRLIPFQIVDDKNTGTAKFNSVTLLQANQAFNASGTDITARINDQTEVYSSGVLSVLAYRAAANWATPLTEGVYYLRVTRGSQTWYSELFTAINNLDGHLYIEWWDEYDLQYEGGLIRYTGTAKYKNRIYLCAEVGKPDYPFTEEGIDRDGYFFPEVQISEKRYRFFFDAPEYLCDVLRVIRLSDYVEVVCKGITYKCDRITFSPAWGDRAVLARVTAEFETDTVIKKTGVLEGKKRGSFKGDAYNNSYDNNTEVSDF